jgi:exodeoxyribonuclease V alpha subunit
VLRGRRLYLRRYWDYESRVVAQVQARTAVVDPVDEALARHWLDRLFDPLPGAAVPPGTDGIAQPVAPDWQKVACALALRGRLSVITGGPGTGKTYTAARLLALLFATASDPARLRVALAAPTGKAAARLKQAIDTALQGLQQRVGAELDIAELARRVGAARTLHALLGARPDTRRLRHDAAHPLEVDVLIVDEASMVHLEMMAALLDALPPGARVVLLGDKDQLASVEAGAVLGDLCHDAQSGRYRADTLRLIEALTGEVLPARCGDPAGPALAEHTVMLRKSQRFGGVIGQLAEAVNRGDVRRATALFAAAGAGVGSFAGETTADAVAGTVAAPRVALPGAPAAGWAQPMVWLTQATPAAVLDLAARGRPGAGGGYRPYLDLLRHRPAEAEAQDDWVRAVMRAFDGFRVLCAVREGEWGVSGLNRAIELQLAAGQWLAPRGEWYVGRPVIVTRNDAGLGVFNGDIGITLPAAPGSAALRVWFVDGEVVRSVSVGRLADVQTAFAMTVHKSQGSEFDHTVLVLPPQGGPVLSRELVYTGITRARSALTLVSARSDALALALQRSTHRSSGLRSRLQGDPEAG